MIEHPYVLALREVDHTQAALVGGKGANLGALSRIDGISVPAGFCVTTHAFQRALALAAPLVIPEDVAAAITQSLVEFGEQRAYAVRSSATAEDLPTASFAGQYDSYLNIVGRQSILEHVRRCWASLFTERAMSYRQRSGVDDRKLRMAVVVQRMVFPHASGVLFTADPLTGNRTITSIEATVGLGDALVSGLVNADVYRVRERDVLDRSIRSDPPTLTDAQAMQLAQLGRKIEAHFGRPQDIEWCLADDAFQIVQSRPITTLFPVPARDDGENHVYVSVGHGQMMTDAMKPLACRCGG